MRQNSKSIESPSSEINRGKRRKGCYCHIFLACSMSEDRERSGASGFNVSLGLLQSFLWSPAVDMIRT